MKQSTFYYLLRRGVIGGGGLQPVVRDFKTRVLADGGTIESIQCVSRALAALPPFDFGRYTFDAFNTRVITDGGVIEARNCTIDSINSLN
jgi:hypothetical protein